MNIFQKYKSIPMIVILVFSVVAVILLLPKPALAPKVGLVTSTPSINANAARDDVFAYIRAHHPQAASLIEPPSDWQPLPEPRIHAMAYYGYSSDTWWMEMTLLYVGQGRDLEAYTFDIEMKYFAPPPFIQWEGKYTEAWGVKEERFFYQEDETERIDPHVVRDLAFEFIMEEHDEVSPPNEVWSLVDVGEGVGQVKHTYTAGDWTIDVYWDEYTASYTIGAYYHYRDSDHPVTIEWQAYTSPQGEDIRETYYDYFFGE